jgi:hypothetical protein
MSGLSAESKLTEYDAARLSEVVLRLANLADIRSGHGLEYHHVALAGPSFRDVSDRWQARHCDLKNETRDYLFEALALIARMAEPAADRDR